MPVSTLLVNSGVTELSDQEKIEQILQSQAAAEKSVCERKGSFSCFCACWDTHWPAGEVWGSLAKRGTKKQAYW